MLRALLHPSGHGFAVRIPRAGIRTSGPKWPAPRPYRAATAVRRFRRDSTNASAQQRRRASTSSPADQAVQELEELYENAKEEFQIASEETEDNTIYAVDDRVAARRELDRLREAYTRIVDGAEHTPDVKSEVQRRAGQRVRELEQAVEAMEERATSRE